MHPLCTLFVIVLKIVEGHGCKHRKVKVAVAAIDMADALRQAREMVIRDQNVDSIVSVTDMEMDVDLRFRKPD